MNTIYMDTPIGRMPVRPGIQKELQSLSDKDLLARLHSGPFVDPEVLAVAIYRGLSITSNRRYGKTEASRRAESILREMSQEAT